MDKKEILKNEALETKQKTIDQIANKKDKTKPRRRGDFNKKEDSRPPRGAKLGSDYIHTDLPSMPSFLDNELNKEVINVVGFNLSGLEVDEYNLKNITTAGKLPVFGKIIDTGDALDSAVGERGYILQDIVNKMAFANDPINGFDGINAVSEDFIELSNSLPFSVTKKIYHNMYGIKDPSEQKTDMFTNTLYDQNIADIKNTFADSLGTDFVINKIKYKRNNSSTWEDAVGYLKYLYDSTLCHVFTIFRHYFIWKSLLIYGEKVNTRRNDFRNKVFSVFFQSAEMINAINNLESALAKFNLPLKYYENFFTEFDYNGKITTGIDSPMEFTIVDVKRPNFRPIHPNNDDTTPLYPTTIWSTVWDAVDELANILSPTTLETMMLRNDLTATAMRTQIANRFNKLAEVLNTYYNQVRSYLVAINRGVGAGVIKEYTDARIVSNNVDAVKRLTAIAGGFSENDSMIAALSYASSLTFTKLENGYLVYGQYYPELTLRKFISSDGILLFNGEQGLYERLYDVTGDIIITFNNVLASSARNDEVLILKLTLLENNQWHMYFQTRQTTINDSGVVVNDINNNTFYIVADHPIVNIVRNELCFNFTMNAKHGTTKVANQIVAKTTKYGSLKYTVKTLSKTVSDLYLLYSTQE